MNSEKIASHETENSAPDFEQIIAKINSTDVTVYEKLNATNLKDAREEFLADDTLVHPNNVYGNLDPVEVAENLAALNLAEMELNGGEISGKQKHYAKIIISDRRHANDFLAANIAYNSAKTPEEKAEAAQYHREANEAYYGKVDEEVFSSLLSEKLSKIKPENLRADDQKIYEHLLAEIGPLAETKTQRFKPQPETVARFSEMVQEFFAGPLAHIPAGQETFTPDDAARITNEIIRDEFGGELTAYHAVVNPERSNADVNHDTRLITFPGSRPKGDYTLADLKTIIVHELGSHTYRAVNYEHHDLAAFSHGLPGSETWEEGVAKCVEQAIAGKYQDSYGIDHYINIGLATFKGKNFREVFNIGVMLKFLAGAKPDETDEARAERLAKIRNANFNPVQRAFRGTGELPNNKDLAYYNGTNQVWKFIEKHLDDPELFDRLFLDGKTIADDPDQARLVYETHVGGL